MKKAIAKTIWVAVVLLTLSNFYFFIRGMSLSNEIIHFEKQTEQLHGQNLELEKKVFTAESLEHAASVAASLGYTVQSQPFNLENLKYALNR